MAKVFQVEQIDLDYHLTLEKSDLGRWAYIVQGCYQLFDSKEEAETSNDEVENG